MTTETTIDLRAQVPEIASLWIAGPDADRLHRRIDGTMLFVDVSGFTAMSERLARLGREGAEQVATIIGDSFDRLLTDAYEYGGTLLKFGGDALLLLFGGEDHALRGAGAALRMRRSLREIGRVETPVGRVQLRMSAGLHSGSFDFFLVGDSHRELFIAGEAASGVVETEGLAGTGYILASDAAAKLLPASLLGPPLEQGRRLRGSVEPPHRVREERTYDAELATLLPETTRSVMTAGGANPEHRMAVIAFIKLTHTDDMIEDLGAEGFAQVLHRFVGAVQRSAARYGVSFLSSDIDENGAKIILTAGAPIGTGHDEESMLLAVRDLLEVDHGLHVKIGVNRGPVFAGEIGASNRRSYTVMGDAVNLAARVMSGADEGQLLATPEVVDASRTLFETRAMEPFRVKGKKEPVRTFDIGSPSGIRGEVLDHELPLVARDEELERLAEAWASARSGQGRVIEVEAEPGLGKSRLIAAFADAVEGGEVHAAECRLYQTTTPYFPFRALLSGALGLSGSQRADLRRLQELVEERAPELLPWLSLIAVTLNYELPESPEVRELEDEFRRARLEESVEALLGATLTEPALLIVEDTHWMDDASSQLLTRLTNAVGDRPWLIVLTRRPQEGGFDADSVPSCDRLTLDALSPEESARLIKAATVDAPLMDQQVSQLAERAQGSPLFLLELIDALRRGEDLAALPQSVDGLIQARIDRLGANDRTALKYLSVLGSSFLIDYAPTVLEDRGDAAGLVERLTDFLTLDDSGWVRFRSGLIRDAAYEGLPYRTRQRLHAIVGDSIYSASAGDPEAQAELLSLHFHSANRWPESWSYSRVAGDRARGIYANREASTFYERALDASNHLDDVEAGARVDVLKSLATVREQAGFFDDAFEALRRATSLCRDDALSRADLHFERARARIRTGLYRSALRELTAGYRLVEDSQDAEARRIGARLLALRGNIRLNQGHPREALDLARNAVAMATETDERLALASAYSVLDGAHQMLGMPEEATHEPQALEIYEELGDLRGVASIANNLGVQAYAEGRWDDAIDWYSRSRDAFGRAGNEPQAAMAGANLAEVLVSQRRFEEAEALLTDAQRVLRAVNFADFVLFAEVQLARLDLARSRVAEAAAALTQLFEEVAKIGHAGMALEAAVYTAEALIADGRAEEALSLLEDAERSAGADAVMLAVPLARVRGRALAARGDLDTASQLITDGLAGAKRQGLLYEEALLLQAQSELANGQGAPDATEALARAESLLQRLGVRS